MLADRRYWDGLEVREHVASEDSMSDEYDTTIGGDLPLSISKVRSNGWELVDDNYGSGGGAGFFVPLPPEVAKLGLPGASFSCMHLGSRNGVWRPIGAYEPDIVVTNVYPP